MPLPDLYLTAEATQLGSNRELRYRLQRGLLVRVRRGVYADAESWARLNAEDRYRMFVRACALVSSAGAQLSHQSAAVMWRLPSFDPWPDIAHELVPTSPGGSSRTGIRRHALGLDGEPMLIDGVTVTSLARTLVDIAATSPFVTAVGMLDDALRPPREGDPRFGWGTALPSVPELQDLLESLLPYRGSLRAALAIRFADGRSGSLGESLARTQFHALGYPAPMLQVPFYDELGLIGDGDFYFPELDLIAEVDGKTKYSAARRYQRALSLDEIVMAEKAREDRMRRVAKQFVRLTWVIVRDRRALAETLRPFGLVPRSRR